MKDSKKRMKHLVMQNDRMKDVSVNRIEHRSKVLLIVAQIAYELISGACKCSTINWMGFDTSNMSRQPEKNVRIFVAKTNHSSLALP